MTPEQVTMMRFEYKKSIMEAVIDPSVDLTLITENEETLRSVLLPITTFATQMLADDMVFYQHQLNINKQKNTDEQEGVQGLDNSDGSE